MQMTAFEHASQRLAGTEQMRLADIFIERGRAHAIRERSRVEARLERQIHDF
jgi:hypothetical protein